MLQYFIYTIHGQGVVYVDREVPVERFVDRVVLHQVPPRSSAASRVCSFDSVAGL